MKNLFQPASVEEVKTRLLLLKPESQRLWGKMNAAQAVEHCSRGLELATGDRRPPRLLIGRVIGRIIKPLAIGNDNPIRKNAPTDPSLIVADERDLRTEVERLRTLIDKFAAAGPQGCTTHPHSFFGPLTPQEWGILTYKHLDHHLRQFGV
ncbi:MAG: DUF1569 domain-containing protein [Bryobacterales bacterium]|nr:DUF1569 domain-containing protein [Bryobacterales bacterium]